MNRALVGLGAAAAVLALVGAASGGGAPSWKAWLCMPGAANDWCSVELTTDVFAADGKHTTIPVSVPSDPSVDCFYVYPTVSEEHRLNADLRLQPEERETAITQAARFSHVCRVYAPLYRQTTGFSYGRGNHRLAYSDVLTAWNDYLAHYNQGRGVVLLGHSQGADVLTELIQNEIDRNPAERKLLVSAILLGGDVTVKQGSFVGGSFQHVPACTSTTETSCVVAYEAWDHTPPGKPFKPFDHGQVYLCVNPAALRGGSAPITPIFAGINSQGIVPDLSKYVGYHWVEFPNAYTAKCVVRGGQSWLLVSRIHTPGDHRPTVTEALGPDSGLHAADVNLTLADLVELVSSQARAWVAHR